MEIHPWLKKLYEKHDLLLQNIKNNLPELETLLENSDSHWEEEDKVYRFYHHSFKVYEIQHSTQLIVDALEKISPNDDKKMNQWFCSIIKEGVSGKRFDISHNSEWERHCRPFLEAYFHAKYFLKMAVKYGKELDNAPDALPSGWAALLELYCIR